MNRPATRAPDRANGKADAASLAELRSLVAQMTEAERAELRAYVQTIIAERGAK